MRIGAVTALIVTIGAGLVGTDDPGRNINVTLFWIVFLLGFTYATLFVGDLYSLINPWQVIARWAQQGDRVAASPRLSYPPAVGYWPALVSYFALIWLELFVPPTPFTLSVILIVYSAMTWTGVYLFGRDTWFRQGDVFAVFFRLVSTLAPVEYAPSSDGKSWRVYLRPPLVGALQAPPEVGTSLVLFVLFMLSSTTYDALHQTVLWASWFWRPMLSLSEPLWGDDLGKAQRLLENWFLVYQRLGLLLSPFLYLAPYMLCLAWARAVAGVSVTLRRLAPDFAYSLIPIVVAYHLTHYAPLLAVEVPTMLWRLADPLGAGWNLFHMADPTSSPPT